MMELEKELKQKMEEITPIDSRGDGSGLEKLGWTL